MVNDHNKKDFPHYHGDRRDAPRIGFRIPATVMGMKDKAQIVDFSLSGFFVQIDSAGSLKKDQRLRLALRFPDEKKSTVLIVKVVRIELDGFGCQFVDLAPPDYDLLKRNFDFFSTTLPLG